VCYILRKFDINGLYACPPHLYTVATLPWEIQKSRLIFDNYFKNKKVDGFWDTVYVCMCVCTYKCSSTDFAANGYSGMATVSTNTADCGCT